MGTALRLALPEESVTFGSYERLSYGRFSIDDLNIETPQASIRIDRIESYAPASWLWRVYQEKDSDPFANVGEVQFELKSPEAGANNAASPGPANLFEVLELARSPLELLSVWAPHVAMESVKGSFADGSFELKNIVWRDSELAFLANSNQFSKYNFQVVAAIFQESVSLRVESPEANLEILGNLSLQAESANLILEVGLKEDRLQASALFDRSGWIPVNASWRANEWSVETDEYGIPGPFARFDFSIEGDWKDGAYINILIGHATPKANGAVNLPSLDIEGTVSGNEKDLRIEDFRLSGPGVQASATEPIGLTISELDLSGEVKFDIDLDLSILNTPGLRGNVFGGAFLSADETGVPTGRFNLEGSGVEYENLKSEVLKVDAALDWPNLSIDSLDVTLETGSRINAIGGVDLENRVVTQSEIDIEFSETILKKLVPDRYVIKDVKASAMIAGPFDSIEHSGDLFVGLLEVGDLKPLNANLAWKGRDRTLESFGIQVTNEVAGMELSGSGLWISNQLEIQLDSLMIETSGQSLASLQNPSLLKLSMDEPIVGSVTEFVLEGQDSKLQIETAFSFPQKAESSLVLEGLDSVAWVDPWLKNPIPNTRINQLNISAGWMDGPITANSVLDAVVFINENALSMNGRITLEDRSINLGAFAISDTEGPLLELEGELPYEIDPNISGYFSADPDAPMSFSMETRDSPTIIALLNSASPVEIESLTVSALFNGTIGKPEGNLQFNLLTKEGEGEYGAPSARIAALARIDGPRLEVEDLSVSVLEQTFEASLGVLLPEEILRWVSLDLAQVDWMETQFNFSSPSTSLAPIAFLVPQILTASGTFESQFSGSPKEGFSGFVSVGDLNTRPIFPFGSFRNIQARLKLDRTIATLENFKGDIGREPMSMSGDIDFQDIEDLAFRFAIKGDDLPVLRQAGLLLRSDLDVVASKKPGSQASIIGEIELKEGLFLMDTSALRSSGGGQSAETRPPYFSVDVLPFADWGLEIAVKGDRFMRLETPAAAGVLTMDMELKGTLKEPLAIGRVEFENGRLMFPFASFDLTEGLIELRIEDPYTPALSLIGEGQRFRYDLGIEILGSAYDPRIRFTSSPPLSSEQILLMVMAGDVPDENFSYSASQRASKIGTYLSQGLLLSGGGEGLGSRFSLVTGQNLSEQGKETLEMEFRLDDQFQLLGEYDEYDAWNTGIRWRAIRRKAKKDSDDEKQEVSE